MQATGWARNEPTWSPEEKKLARKAFEQAYNRQCAALLAKIKEMIASSADPNVIWQVHDYLSEQRKEVDCTFDYRYSVLQQVFGKLLCEGWLTEADLAGLGEDKLKKIKLWATL